MTSCSIPAAAMPFCSSAAIVLFTSWTILIRGWILDQRLHRCHQFERNAARLARFVSESDSAFDRERNRHIG